MSLKVHFSIYERMNFDLAFSNLAYFRYLVKPALPSVIEISVLKNFDLQSCVVSYTCNPSYIEVDQEDHCSVLAQAKKVRETPSQNTHKKTKKTTKHTHTQTHTQHLACLASQLLGKHKQKRS
jgi:hypothetical protein